MRILLHTTHHSVVGGGENYLMRLSIALNKCSDFYVTHNWHEEFEKYNGFYERFREYRGLWVPDTFVYCSHFSTYPPIGRINTVVVLFPKTELKREGYDNAISICHYSQKYTEERWGLQGTVIYPAIEASKYSRNAKSRKIVSIGHFFREKDGHSKNQHVLVEAFDPQKLSGYELVLIGNASSPDDMKYVEYIRQLVRERGLDKHVRIEINKHSQDIKAELASASHLWHANGYGRSDPAQTEHFGIIVLEAIASGCIPIVHNSGGAREITGLTWDNPQELNDLTLRHTKVPELDVKYSVEYFEKEVAKWVSSMKTILTSSAKAQPAPPSAYALISDAATTTDRVAS